MRKAVLITLIIIVLAGIGFILFMQVTTTAVVFAGTDKTVIYEGSSLSISNKYYIGLSQDEVLSALDAMENLAEGAQTAYNAILAKGTPVFHPTFMINAIDNGVEYFRISGEATDDLLPDQKQIGYQCTDIRLDISTDGGTRILALNNTSPKTLERTLIALPVISDTLVDGAMLCGENAFYDLILAFESGVTSSVVTFTWSFNVRNSSLFNLSGMDEQVLSADVIFTLNGGVLSAQFA